jgi:hypothetical protein
MSNTFYPVNVTVLEINTRKGEMERARIVNVHISEAVGIEVHMS